jgi:NADH-quinone oxidoreductase subunit E/NADP-reducing hydrogenase subunit HndA
LHNSSYSIIIKYYTNKLVISCDFINFLLYNNSNYIRKEGVKMSKPISQKKTYSMENLPKEKFDLLDEYIDTISDKEGSLIHILHKAQEIFTFLPMEVQLHIARKVDIPASKVFGVASFYSYFTSNPVGKHKISVCMGTACFVRGSNKIFDKLKELLNVQSGETTEDKVFTLKDVRCVGACGLAPIVMVDDKVYGRVKLEDLEGILDEYRGGE